MPSPAEPGTAALHGGIPHSAASQTAGLHRSRPRALLTRHTHQGRGWAEALESAGFECVLVPVIDFAFSAQMAEAAASVPEQVAAVHEQTGLPALLTLTSANTVRALLAAGAVSPLADLQKQGAVLVGVVGEGTVAAAESVGLKADLVPGAGDTEPMNVRQMNARGLLELVQQKLCPEDSETLSAGGGGGPAEERRIRVGGAVVPQGDLAQPILAEGLQEQGFSVETVTVYATVSSSTAPAPVSEPERLPRNLPEDAANLALSQAHGTSVLTVAEAVQQTWDVLIPTSPSALRALASAGFDLAQAPLVSLGPSTTRAAWELGYEALEAEQPSAAGIAKAAAHAVGFS